MNNMRSLLKFIFLLMVPALTVRGQEMKTLNLLPYPKSLEQREGALIINSRFNVSVRTSTPDTLLLKAVNRFYQALNRKTGLYFTRDYIRFQDRDDSSVLQVHTRKVVVPGTGTDESYELKVTGDHIFLEAATTSGALHGLQTLLQLCSKSGSQFSIPYVAIKDEPRFPWRGLMIDVARHFIPLDVLERNIEAMAAVKMNVLHLHLTDDQGFRMESRVFPDLCVRGSNGEFYTQSQMKELISFARDRGIEIVPEFDMPGHTKSWFAGHPELASAPGPYEAGQPVDFQNIKGTGIGAIIQYIHTAPFPAMDPSRESTYTFLEKFFAEMASIFPSPYVHIGADEVNGVAWKNNPAISAFMEKNKMAGTSALQAYFVKRVYQIIQKNKKQVIGWEELYSKELPGDVTVQVWQNAGLLKMALENGNPAILSQGFYLDILLPAYIYYNNQSLPAGFAPELANKMRGGEAAQWTEIADGKNIETRIWPRAAAVAERLWSPPELKEVEDMYRRLYATSRELDVQGLRHITEYERALRYFANGRDITDLKRFIDVLTPVKGYKKLFARFYASRGMLNQQAPLMEVSDVIFIDSEVRWKFRSAVRSYLQNKDSVSEAVIRGYLLQWQKNESAISELFQGSDQLKRIQEHSKNLTEISSLGLEALERIKRGTPASGEWVKESTLVLKNADKAVGETEIAIIAEIEALVTQKLAPLPLSFSPF
jgi:hexosaminidase